MRTRCACGAQLRRTSTTSTPSCCPACQTRRDNARWEERYRAEEARQREERQRLEDEAEEARHRAWLATHKPFTTERQQIRQEIAQPTRKPLEYEDRVLRLDAQRAGQPLTIRAIPAPDDASEAARVLRAPSTPAQHAIRGRHWQITAEAFRRWAPEYAEAWLQMHYAGDRRDWGAHRRHQVRLCQLHDAGREMAA